MGRKSRKSSTSSFGSPGRRNHDASAFYNGRLYHNQPREKDTAQIENSVPSASLNRIFCCSAEKMTHLPDNSIHLLVTSPPYNVGKEYDADLTLEEYISFLEHVWVECYRVLVPGGRACINIANLGRKPYLPLHIWVTECMLKIGYLMRGEVIWNKAASASSSTAWGSWKSATNPTLRDIHEYILIFSKASYKRAVPLHKENTISDEEFLEFTKSIWTFPAEPASKVGHPAPFPIELPYRLIQLYSFKGDVVLDPFMGSGQTALAALKAGRHFVGYEINPDYVALAERRIQTEVDSSS
jgi:DNA modification methylase